jgi:hypothetical protein
MNNVFWWIRQVILVLVGCFFLFFGISILVAAYKLNDPFSFIMTFFASNLMILISATLVVGFIIRMVRVFRASKTVDSDGEDVV